MEGMKDVPDRTETAKKVQFKTQSNLKEVLPRNLMLPVMDILILWRAQMLSMSPLRQRSSDDLVEASAQLKFFI